MADVHERAHADWFWPQMNQLLLFVGRGASRAVQNLIDSITWAIGNRNELALAMSVRALLEHAAALDRIHASISEIADRLQTDIWPHFCPRAWTDNPALLVTEKDESVRRKLLCHAVGRVVQISKSEEPSLADPQQMWDAYTRSLNSIPEELKPERVGDLVKQMAIRRGRPDLVPSYRLISEYCHPNSASRALDFHILHSQSGTHQLIAGSTPQFSTGFLCVFSFCPSVVPVCYEAIDEALSILGACHKPIPDEPYGQSGPFIGAIPILDSFGRQSWVKRESILSTGTDRELTLTPEQEQRIEKIHERLGPAEDMPLEKSLELFAREGPYVEDEILLWEHFVRVYEQEMSNRSGADAVPPKLLIHAIKESSFHSSVASLLSANPELKAVPRLERLFQRVKGRTQ